MKCTVILLSYQGRFMSAEAGDSLIMFLSDADVGIIVYSCL